MPDPAQLRPVVDVPAGPVDRVRLDELRARPEADPDRVAPWAFSGGAGLPDGANPGGT